MDVTLDGGHEDLADALQRAGREFALEPGEGGLHGVRGDHDLREEEGAVAEALAHLVQAHQERLRADLHRGEPLSERLLDQGDHTFQLAVDDRLGEATADPFRLHGGFDGGAGAGRCGLGRGGHRLPLVGLDVAGGVRILAEKHHRTAPCRHHGRLLHVDDGRGEPCGERHGEEGGGDERTAGKPEGDVGDPERRVELKLAHLAHRLEGDESPLRFCAHGEGEAVYDDVAPLDPHLRGTLGDLLCHGHPTVCLGGDARFVESEADEGRTVFLRERKHRGHALLLAVHRVDEHLAVRSLEAPLKRLGRGGVEHERGLHRASDAEDGALHGGRLVDPRGADVHVEQRRPEFGLLQRLAADVAHLPFPELLGVELLSGRVDALADERGRVLGTHRREGAAARDPGGAVILLRNEGGLFFGKGVLDGPDVGGSRAAAPADYAHAEADHAVVVGGHLVRGAGEYGDAVFKDRQPRIRLGDERERGHLSHGAEDVVDAVHAEAAVRADEGGARRLEGDGRRLRRRAEHASSLLLEGEHGDDRDIGGEVADGDEGRADLLDVEEGLQRDEVGAGVDERLRLFLEHAVSLVEAHVADRFHETPGGAYGTSDVGVFAADLTGQAHRLRVDAGHLVAQPVVFQLRLGAAEGVGDDDVRARLEVGAVHPCHHLGCGQVHFLRRLPGFESALLQHRPHGAVQNQHPLLNRLHKRHLHLNPQETFNVLRSTFKKFFPSGLPQCR